MTRSNPRILALHPLRHHFLHSARGIAATGFDYGIVVPFRLDPRTCRMLASFFPARLSTLRHYTFPGLDSTRFCTTAHHTWLTLLRLLSAQRAVRSFDRQCAHEFATGRLQGDFVHIFQDYMPLTARAARQRGARVVVEQISNSSRAVRQRALLMAEKWGFDIGRLGFAASENANDEILAQADMAICPSDFIIEGLRGRFTGRIAHVPYGVDLQRFTPGPKPDPTREFRLVARATTIRKGLTITLAGLQGLIRSEHFAKHRGILRVDFLGDIEPVPSLRATLAEIGRHPRVRLKIGHRDREEVAQMLGAAHALILPSISEGMSLAVVEAAACGAIPIISKYCGQDRFEAGHHGLVLDELEDTAIEVALGELLFHPSRIAGLSAGAQSYALSRDWSKFEAGIAQGYTQLLAGG